MSDALVPATRHRHTVNGRLAYEWCQSLDDVLIVVPDVPPAPARAFCVSIQATRLTLGLVNNPPYLDLDLAGRVKPSESVWTLEDGQLHVSLTKADRGEPWPAAFAAHAPATGAPPPDAARLLLERFQEEHPGLDFSGAAVSGAAPDPRTFLGGIGRPPG